MVWYFRGHPDPAKDDLSKLDSYGRKTHTIDFFYKQLKIRAF
jgi:hypothetical protein